MAQTNKVIVENLTLLQNPIKTYLTTDLASGSASATVKNITGFAVNQVLILGELGNEGTELIYTHASTAPTGSTITFNQNTTFPHSSGTPIYVIDFDKVEISNAVTSTSTKVVLNTIFLQVDSQNTIYDDTIGSSGYYFARFYNTLTSIYTPYSDAIPTGGYPINSSRKIIDNALGMINKQTSELLTDQFCFNEINNCQMEVLREYKRWSFMQVFDYSLGQLATGQWRVAVPTNLDDQNTNKSIYNFHIGTMDDLVWVDKQKWNEIIVGVAHTTLASNINVSDATIVLTDASNFDPNGGSIYIGANIYGYASITGNTLTLNSVSTTTNTAGQDVFQGASLGSPTYWTTFGGYLYFYPVLGSTYNLREGLLDYYIAPQPIVNDSDTIVLPDPNVVIFYLAWKCLLKINNGVDDASTHPMYDSYDARKQTLMRKEVIGRTVQMHPLKNSLVEENNIDNKAIRTGAFPNSFY
jgi:hypothetical protein